jgi:hypothetical protein
MNLRRLAAASIRSSSSSRSRSCAIEEGEKLIAGHFRQFAFDGRVDLRRNQFAPELFGLALGGTEFASPAVAWDALPVNSQFRFEGSVAPARPRNCEIVTMLTAV